MFHISRYVKKSYKEHVIACEKAKTDFFQIDQSDLIYLQQYPQRFQDIALLNVSGFSDKAIAKKFDITLNDLRSGIWLCSEIILWHKRVEYWKTLSREELLKIKLVEFFPPVGGYTAYHGFGGILGDLCSSSREFAHGEITRYRGIGKKRATRINTLLNYFNLPMVAVDSSRKKETDKEFPCPFFFFYIRKD